MKERKWNRLSMLATVFMMLAVLWPGGKVQAAGRNTGMKFLNSVKTIEVEVGQKFYIIDFLMDGLDSSLTSVSSNKVAYSTSNKKIASISKGCVTAKKVGTAKITAKYNKKKYVCTLKVVKKGKLGTTTTYKRMNTLAKKLAGYYSKEINSDNCLEVAKAVVEYRNLADANKKKLNGDWGYILKTGKLAVPLASRIDGVESELSMYASDYVYYKNLPGNISRITAKGGSSTFTITLKKKLSQKDFYMLASYAEVQKTAFGAKPYITMDGSLYDEDGHEGALHVIYTLRPGTDKVTAALYKDSKCTKPRKLTKGNRYGTSQWGEYGYGFTAK